MSKASQDARLVIENARILPLDPSLPEEIAGSLAVGADGRIAWIGEGAAPAEHRAERRIDAEGRWLIPGFVSAHSHLWQSAFAGMASDSDVGAWSDSLYSAAASFTGARLYELAYNGARAHLRNGITTAFNFTYSGGDRTGQLDRAQFLATLRAGMRFVHGLGIGRISPEWTAAQAERRMATFLDWAAPHLGGNRYLGTMIAGQSVYFDTPDQARAEGAIMAALGLVNHQHFLESPSLVEAERARYDWMRESGMIGDRLILGHLIHTTPDLIADAVANGVTMSWNPLSNGRLGSGTPDIPAYLRAGLAIGLGVDGEASSDRADPFENMRMGLYQVRAASKEAGALSTRDVLAMQTLDSARILGIDHLVGSLAVGKAADMLLLSPAFAPLENAASALVLSAGVEHIETVFVDGQTAWSLADAPIAPAATGGWEEPAWAFPLLVA